MLKPCILEVDGARAPQFRSRGKGSSVVVGDGKRETVDIGDVETKVGGET